MQFYFVRHAQSENNLLYANTGASIGRSDDPEITALGLQQRERLARFLRTGNPDWGNSSEEVGFGITHLYTSLMVRAIETGTLIAKELSLPLVAWEDVHETGGIYLEDHATGTRTGQSGKGRSEFAARFPDLILPDSLGETGWWNRPFEEREQRPPRAQRVVDELLRRHGNREDRVAVISHGGFFNYLLRVIFRIEREECWFALYNCAITRIDFDAEHARLVYLNRVEFLPPDLVS